MSSSFMVQNGKNGFTIVEFMTASLMDPVELEAIRKDLRRLVEEEDHRKMILDFTKVQYLSSQPGAKSVQGWPVTICASPARCQRTVGGCMTAQSSSMSQVNDRRFMFADPHTSSESS